jgi:hypothetical protein
VPVGDSLEVGDLLITDGVRSLMEIQIFSIDTLDDAAALARMDRAENLAKAISLFEEVQAQIGLPLPANATSSAANRLIGAIRRPEVIAKLKEVLELAPNHVSADYALQSMSRKAPTKLSLMGSLNEAFFAIGTFRQGLTGNYPQAEFANRPAAVRASQDLARVKKVADPAVVPVVEALERYCAAYHDFYLASVPPYDYYIRNNAQRALLQRRTELSTILNAVITDRNVIERLMRE